MREAKEINSLDTNLDALYAVPNIDEIEAIQKFQTIEDGVLKVAVTGVGKYGPGHNYWIPKMLEEFAKEHGLKIEFVVVDFDNSWDLAALDKVDVVATGVSTLISEREVEGTTFSKQYLNVLRGIKIHSEDAEKFKSLEDFEGYKIGAGKGMTSEMDIRRRASSNIEIVTPDSWEELYEMFEKGEIQGISEGYYVFPGRESDINNEEEATRMVDSHDFYDGQEEGLSLVVRNKSSNLIDYINEYIDSHPIDPES